MLWTYNQHNFAGGRLDKELMGRQDLQQYHKGATELRNFTIRRQGNLAKRRGTNLACALNDIMGAGAKHRLVPLVYSKEEGYYILLTGGYAYLCSRDGVRAAASTDFLRSATAATAYRIPSGLADYTLDDIDFYQSGDTVFFAHRDVKPFKMTFYRHALEAHGELTLERENVDFEREVNSPPVISGTSKHGWGDACQAAGKSRYVATYVDGEDNESYTSEVKTVSHGLPWPQGANIKLTVTSPGQPKPKSYSIYKDNGAGYGYIGAIDGNNISGDNNKGEFTDTYITPDMSLTPPDGANRKTFSKAGEYPGVVALYQQRMVYGSSKNDPFTFWMSVTGDLHNFSTHSSLREDDAITATLAATEMPEINHAVMTKALMLFTQSGEWEIAPVSGNTLSYKTVSAKMQSAIGSARWVKPMVVGDEIIFADATGERILATRYNFASDGYESQELTVLSQWLFRNNMVRRMAYRRSPDSTIHTVMEDGSVSHLVYMKEHDVCAWSRHDLGGGWLAKDVACSKAVVRGSTDLMYLVYSPTAGKYELWSERDDTPVRRENSIADFVCMDACRDLAAGATVPAGMVAVGKSTGREYAPGEAAPAACVCGYPFQSKYESIYPDVKGDDSLQMEITNATEARIRTIDSSSFSVGAVACNPANHTDVIVPVACAAGKVTLGDKDARVVLTGANARESRIRIVHDGVFPLNILSVGITYQVEAENRNGGGNG